MLGDLAEDEVAELLRLVAEVEHAPVLADDAQHLLTHVDHQLGLDDRVVARAHHAHLPGGWQRGEQDFPKQIDKISRIWQPGTATYFRK